MRAELHRDAEFGKPDRAGQGFVQDGWRPAPPGLPPAAAAGRGATRFAHDFSQVVVHEMATEALAEMAEGVLTVVAVMCAVVIAVLAALELGVAALIVSAAELLEAAILAVVRAFASGGAGLLFRFAANESGAGTPAAGASDTDQVV